MKVIIDRFEGDFAIVELEKGKVVNMPRVLIPSEAKEGMVIKIDIDINETRKREKNISNLMEEVWSQG